MQGVWSVFCHSLSLSSAYRLKKGYLEDSAACAHAAQARYPPLLEDVQIIERPTFEAKEEAPKNNPGMLGSIAETISWLMTATWQGAKLLSFEFVLGGTLQFPGYLCMHHFGI